MTSIVALEKLSEEDFRTLQAWAKERGSLSLKPAQRVVAEKRLHPLLWKHKVATFGELCGYLQRGMLPELQADALEALTAGQTRFFRDPASFEYLRAEVLPKLIAARAQEKSLRVWSAACSSGQEAYSLAMLLDAMPELQGWRVEMIGSDLCSRGVKRAQQAIYTREEVNQGLPTAQLVKYFQQDGIVWTARPELKAKVEFKVQRLDSDFSSLGFFDLILLRNVLPAMDEGKSLDVLYNAYQQLAADGILMLGNHEDNELSATDSEADAYFGCYRRSEMFAAPEAA